MENPYGQPEAIDESNPYGKPEAKPAGALRKIADVGLSAGQGAAGAFKALSDLAGADNIVSRGLGNAGDFLQDQKSDQSKAITQNSMARIKAAEESGSTWEEAKAYGKMLADQPAEMLAQGAGSFVTMGLGKAAQAAKMATAVRSSGLAKQAFLSSPAGMKAAQEAADIGFKANIGIGAGMGVGAVKGSQYEQTFNNAKVKGMGDDEAAALATKAQEYGGDGTGQQLLGAGLGALASATGPIERVILGKGAREAGQGMAMGIGKGFAIEGATEGAQGAQERFAGNVAAVDAGVLDQENRMRGVVGQGLMEGAIGGALGGGMGVFDTRPDTPTTQPPVTPTGSTPPGTPPVAPPGAPLQIGNTPDPYLSFADGTVARKSEFDNYINSLPPEQQNAERAKVMGLAPQPSVAETFPPAATTPPAIEPIITPQQISEATDIGLRQVVENLSFDTNKAGDRLNTPQDKLAAQLAQEEIDRRQAGVAPVAPTPDAPIAPTQTPAEQAGINASAGPLSAAAATAVNAGITPITQAPPAVEAAPAQGPLASAVAVDAKQANLARIRAALQKPESIQPERQTDQASLTTAQSLSGVSEQVQRTDQSSERTGQSEADSSQSRTALEIGNIQEVLGSSSEHATSSQGAWQDSASNQPAAHVQQAQAATENVAPFDVTSAGNAAITDPKNKGVVASYNKTQFSTNADGSTKRVGRDHFESWANSGGVTSDVGSQYDGHGIAKGNPLGALLNILENGINTTRRFDSAPLTPASSAAGAGSGLGSANGAYKDGPFILLGARGKSILDGIKTVLVSDEVAATIPDLQQRFPNVRFVSHSNAQSVLSQDAVNSTPAATTGEPIGVTPQAPAMAPPANLQEGIARMRAKKAQESQPQGSTNGTKADQAQPQQAQQQEAPAAAVDQGDGINDSIRVLRAKSFKTVKQGGPRGDVRLSTGGEYVSFDDAVAEARKAVAGGVRPVPFQIHNALDVGIGETDRIIAALGEPVAKPVAPPPATPAVAPKKPAGGKSLRSAAYDKNPLLTFLATHGLFHDKTKPGSQKSEYSPDKGIMVMGYGPIFKRTGKQPSDLVVNAIQDGYLPVNGTVDQLDSLIRRAINGEKISPLYAEGVAEQIAEQSFAEHLAQQQEAAQDDDFDPFESVAELGFALDDAEVSGYDTALDPIKLEVNALLAKAEELGIDTETIRLDATYATQEQSEQAYYEYARDALQAAITASSGNRGANAGSESNAGAQEGLTATTPEQLRADEARATQIAKDKAKADQDAEAKAKDARIAKEIAARQDASADNFQLGQSAVDSLAGQGSIFDAPAPTVDATQATPSKNFRNPDTLNVLRNPIEDKDWFKLKNGEEWQARQGYSGRGWSLVRNGSLHPEARNFDSQSDFIRSVINVTSQTQAQGQVQAEPKAWHTAIPEKGIAFQLGDEKVDGSRQVLYRIATEAANALTQAQKMNGQRLYAYYLPSTSTEHGAVRLFPDDQTLPKPWTLLAPEGIPVGMMTADNLMARIREALQNAPVLTSGNEKAMAEALRNPPKAKAPKAATTGKFDRHNAIANEYGYAVSDDGSISTKEGKESGLLVINKGKRIQVRSKTSDDIIYSGASVESMGKFLESFWGAEKTAKPDDAAAFATKKSNAALPPVDESVIMEIINRIDGVRQAAGDARVVLVGSPSELPVKIQEQAKLDGIPENEIHGVLYKGQAFIVRQNLTSEADVEEVLVHEVLGHGGANAAFGKLKNAVLLESFDRAGGLDGLRDAARQLGVLDELNRRIPAGTLDFRQKITAVDEMLALAQGKTTMLQQAALQFLNKVRNHLIDALNALGFTDIANRLDKFDASEAAVMLRQMREAVIDGGDISGDGVVFMVKTTSVAEAKIKNLVTLHNLTTENLLHAASIGGIPVPSIGITKVDSAFGGFGEITLIAPKGMIDPADGVPVFDRDAYTSRYPSMNFKKVSSKKADAFYEHMNKVRDLGYDGGFVSQIWDAIKNASTQNPDKVWRVFQQYDAPRLLFAKEVLGKDVKIPMKAVSVDYPWVADKQFAKTLASLRDTLMNYGSSEVEASPEMAELSNAARAAIERYVDRNGREADPVLRKDVMEAVATSWGDRGAWASDASLSLPWKSLDRIFTSAKNAGKTEVDKTELSKRLDRLVPTTSAAFADWAMGLINPLFDAPTITLRGKEVEPTLSNVVDAMTVGATAGSEKTMVSGPGKIAAMLGKRFKSLTEIQAARDQVVPESVEKTVKEATNKTIEDYRNRALSFYTEKDWRGQVDTWGGNDAAMEALAAAGKIGKGDAAIRMALARKGFKSVDQTTVDLARASIEAIRSSATNYFEAKPQRAVKLNEFRGAVVPKGTSQEVLDVLAANGIEVATYSKADPEAKSKALGKLAKKIDKPQGDVLFSTRVSPPEKQLPLYQIKRLVESALSGMKNAPTVRVVANPEAIGLTPPVDTVPSGVTMTNGDIYVFQSGIGSVLDVDMVVFHELFHKGLQNVMPKADYVAAMQEISKADAKVRQYASEWSATKAGKAALAELAEKYGGKELADQYEALATEEALARIAEDLKANREMGNKPLMVRRLVAWLAKLADKVGMTRLADKIRALSYNAAEKFVVDTIGKSGGRGPGGGVKFSAGDAAQTDTAAFRKWFGDSKVADAAGKPQVMYHGTMNGDVKFMEGSLAFFSSNPDVAETYTKGRTLYAKAKDAGRAIYPVYISLQNPLIVEAKQGDTWNQINVELPNGDGGLYSTDDLAKWARTHGHDGLIVRGVVDVGSGKVPRSDEARKKFVGDTIAVFDATQIKSATGNNGDFDATNPDIRFRAADKPATATNPNSWDAPEASKFDDLVYKLQDKQIDTKRVIESIKLNGALADEKNVYLQEELFHGRAAARTEDFVNKELSPLVNMMKLSGIDIATLDEYLHARHAEEANKLIADRNPDILDGGSGMTTQDARDYLAKLPQAEKAKLEAVAAKVDAILGATRQLYSDYDLESQKTVDGWGAMFKHYVPLMREDKDGGMGIGQGISIKGREVKSRTGSTRKVVDILANIALQRERAIVRGEKNRVATALVGLVKANPNKDFWHTGYPPSEKVYDAKTNKVITRADPLYKSRENVVVAKIRKADGTVVEQAVIFNEDDARAVRMAAALKNLDAAQLEGLLGVSAKITRYFAAINTQYNPIFGTVNLVRDVQGALFNLTTTPLKGQTKAIAGDTLSALKGIYIDARAARDGKTPTSKWAALWEEFQNEGGQTGFRDLFANSADRSNAIKRELNPNAWMDSPLGKVFTADGTLKVPLAVAQKKATGVFDWLSDYNLAMENAVRLASYKAGIDQGMSKPQAASLAKNLTVNFNRKGQVGQQAGALYAFFNASMQGTARLGQTLFTMEPGKPKTIRLSATGKKIVYGGVLLGVAQAVLLSVAGFDDEEPPDFVRERSMIIPTGGKTYITIPMPLGLHVLPNMGRIPTEFVMGGLKDPAKHIAKMLGLFAGTFNPIGGGASLVQMLSPTAIDPLVALAENKDWTGKPIAKVSFDKAIPGHQLAKDTASTPAKFLSEAINLMTGGTEYAAGVLSPTPDQIDYLWGQATGGVGREVNKANQTVSSVISGEELPPHKMPLVGRFYGNADAQSSQSNQFYANINRLNKHEAEIKGRRKDGDAAGAAQYLSENPDARLFMAGNKAERDVQKLRSLKRDLIDRDADKAQVTAIEDRIKARVAQFNELVKAYAEKEAA